MFKSMAEAYPKNEIIGAKKTNATLHIRSTALISLSSRKIILAAVCHVIWVTCGKTVVLYVLKQFRIGVISGTEAVSCTTTQGGRTEVQGHL